MRSKTMRPKRGTRLMLPTALLALVGACHADRSPASTNKQTEEKQLSSMKESGSTREPSMPSRREMAMLHARLRLPPARGTVQPLTICDVFALGDSDPRYIGRLAEGNVAPYGVVLMANRDPVLVKELLDAQVDGLWEYSSGYGATSADTAMVLDGLLAVGADRNVLASSLERLARSYYDHESGGFVTLHEGRAAYWAGPSAGVTAQIAYLLHEVDKERFKEEIASSARFVLDSQAPDGGWSDKWFPSVVMSVFHAVRLLTATQKPEYAEAIRAATRFIVDLQRADGSVSGSVIETSLTLLSLRAANSNPSAQAKAATWLRRQLAAGITAGEPVLYYWFDDAGGSRTFFTCRDRGKLAHAWAQIALR